MWVLSRVHRVCSRSLKMLVSLVGQVVDNHPLKTLPALFLVLVLLFSLEC